MASKYDQPQHVSITHLACQCNISGTKDGWAWCERHQVKKTAHWVRLCQSRPDYFQAWEEGRGPGQPHPKVPEELSEPPKTNPAKRQQYLLGDCISSALSLVGITEDRVSKWLGRPCGCSRRREKLNRLDSWARGVISKTIEDAKESLERIIGK
jgi:hypothetical protein